MALTKDEIQKICESEFQSLKITADCATIVHSIANKNPSGAAKVLEQTLLKAVSGCISKVLEESNQ